MADVIKFNYSLAIVFFFSDQQNGGTESLGVFDWPGIVVSHSS